ncbi:hypothetical protein D3Z60_19495 [Lachnospiraceae bacterium]|nr:hypothetical protein [Lachnospiraceae bacterium]
MTLGCCTGGVPLFLYGRAGTPLFMKIRPDGLTRSILQRFTAKKQIIHVLVMILLTIAYTLILTREFTKNQML